MYGLHTIIVIVSSRFLQRP